MRLEFELNVGVGEGSQEVEAEDVGVEETRQSRPIANGEELEKGIRANSTENLLPLTFSSQNSSSEIGRRPMTCDG
jgi:hypothetical protein